MAEEDECEDDQSGEGGEDLVQKQAKELQAVFKQFGDGTCKTTGKAHDTDHGIDYIDFKKVNSITTPDP